MFENNSIFKREPVTNEPFDLDIAGLRDTLQVDSKAKPAFPRQTSVWWFDCKSAQNTPLGLSAELRAPVFIGNESLVENTSPPAASYSSHMLEVDKDRDVEIVEDSAMTGHRAHPREMYLTHESESLTRNSSSGLKPVSLVLLLIAFLCLGLQVLTGQSSS